MSYRKDMTDSDRYDKERHKEEVSSDIPNEKDTPIQIKRKGEDLKADSKIAAAVKKVKTTSECKGNQSSTRSTSQSSPTVTVRPFAQLPESETVPDVDSKIAATVKKVKTTSERKQTQSPTRSTSQSSPTVLVRPFAQLPESEIVPDVAAATITTVAVPHVIANLRDMPHVDNLVAQVRFIFDFFLDTF
jgi:hypothetical protein